MDQVMLYDAQNELAAQVYKSRYKGCKSRGCAPDEDKAKALLGIWIWIFSNTADTVTWRINGQNPFMHVVQDTRQVEG